MVTFLIGASGTARRIGPSRALGRDERPAGLWYTVSGTGWACAWVDFLAHHLPVLEYHPRHVARHQPRGRRQGVPGLTFNLDGVMLPVSLKKLPPDLEHGRHLRPWLANLGAKQEALHISHRRVGGALFLLQKLPGARGKTETHGRVVAFRGLMEHRDRSHDAGKRIHLRELQALKDTYSKWILTTLLMALAFRASSRESNYFMDPPLVLFHLAPLQPEAG